LDRTKIRSNRVEIFPPSSWSFEVAPALAAFPNDDRRSAAAFADCLLRMLPSIEVHWPVTILLAALEAPTASSRIAPMRFVRGVPHVSSQLIRSNSNPKKVVPVARPVQERDADPLLSRKSEIVKTVADQFSETLAAAGVKRIYGIVDDS
jgi:hypothetical protein